ncbi:nucleoside deaminase [Paenibacillus ihuae]|uniref:nucleoside deaminase n=1 Tax=Paenibacillus ihuae TaxID=1232431 RepID=UPI0006D5A6FD|nr:nucleoside deaminase [Paenibacillus ihuae]
MISELDLEHLKRCIDLARTALEHGDEPFGSLLVDQQGNVLAEDYNHVSGGDHTQHPEFALARWAANHLTPEERAKATVYTSGEHCPMCAAAHAWVGLGRIVYASSSAQLAQWMEELNVPPTPVYNLSIQEIIRNATVDGPVPELADQIKVLHVELQQRINRS